MEGASLREKFFGYCGTAAERDAARVLLQDRQPYFIKELSGVEQAWYPRFGPETRVERRALASGMVRALNDARLEATAELVDMDAIVANVASPEAMQYWLWRLRRNDMPAALVGDGVIAYASWLRHTIRPRGTELIEAHIVQERSRDAARRVLQSTQGES